MLEEVILAVNPNTFNDNFNFWQLCLQDVLIETGANPFFGHNFSKAHSVAPGPL